MFALQFNSKMFSFSSGSLLRPATIPILCVFGPWPVA